MKQHLLHCLLNVIVSQCVDNGIQHRFDNRVEYRDHLVEVKCTDRLGLNIHEDCGAKEDDDEGEVYSTSRECLFLSLGCWDVKYSVNNEDIGDDGEGERHEQHQRPNNEIDYFSLQSVLQESFKIGGASQKKWLTTFELQNGSWKRKLVGDTGARKPPNQEPNTSRTQVLLFISVL